MKVLLSKAVARNAITARLDELKDHTASDPVMHSEIKELRLALTDLDNPSADGIHFQTNYYHTRAMMRRVNNAVF
jgi:hypothetical protein